MSVLVVVDDYFVTLVVYVSIVAVLAVVVVVFVVVSISSRILETVD